MDTVKIGRFLAELRKERNLTQEQLGEALGVTNKTVSRWETGVYLPPVELLQKLSEIHQLSINEILSGERLSEEAYKVKAEENIVSVMKNSFSLKEKIHYYKKKWMRDHMTSLILGVSLLVAVLIFGVFRREPLCLAAFWVGSVLFYMVQRNRMMIYVEERAFDGSGIH